MNAPSAPTPPAALAGPGKKPRAAVLRFPGSNCDQDCLLVLREVAGFDARFVWHKDPSPLDADLIVVPGGFSYGDYLRCGAIARYSPVMRAVVEAAREGRPVLGICNGFQILCEAGLLPGALVRNRSLHFVCRDVWLRVGSGGTPFTRGLEGRVLRMPVAHGEGCYFAEPETLDRLEGEGRVVFRYVAGPRGGEANPNGSLRDIAGICSEGRNVLGMMPHPERACEAILGGSDGLPLFASALEALSAGCAGAAESGPQIFP